MSDTFNWQLPPAPGYPGAKPPQQPQQPQQPDQTRGVYDQQPRQFDQPSKQILRSPDDDDEPYIPSRLDRPYDQWGKPDLALQGALSYPGLSPGPFMPQARDLAGLIHGAVMGLGRYGSRYTGMPAIAMGTYASAYWNAYQKGMRQRAAESWQQYRQARQMTIDRGKEEMAEFTKVYAAYHENGKITDVEGFTNALLTTANKYHNQSIINAINSGNLGMAERILQATDSQIGNLAKAQHQEERQKQLDDERRQRQQQIDEDRRLRNEMLRRRLRDEEEKRKALEDARKRIDPNATGPGPGYNPTYEDPGSTPPPEPDEAPAGEGGGGTGELTPPDDTTQVTAPDDTAQAEPPDIPDGITQSEPQAPQRPIQVADASGQVPFGRVEQETPPSPTRGFGQGLIGQEGKAETPVIEEAAKNLVFGRKLPASFDKKTMPDLVARAEARAAQLEKYLNGLANNPKVNSDQMKQELHRLFPGFANFVDKAIAGDVMPPRTLGASNQAFWNMVYNVGTKIDPKFTADTFAERAKARIFWTSGPGGNKLTSVATAFKHLRDLRELVENGAKPTQIISPFTEWWATHFGEIGEFNATLNTAMHEYENALASSGASGGGSATIPALKDATKELTVNQSDRNFLANIDQKRKLLMQRLEELQRQYITSTGRPSEEIMRRFEEYTREAAPFVKGTDPKLSDDLRDAPQRLKDLQNGDWGSSTKPSGPSGQPGQSGGKAIDYKDYFK